MSDSIPLSDLARAPAAKFEAYGDRVRGPILSVKREQQTNLDTGAPMFWNDGSPRLQLVVTLDTPDGPQAVYARGGSYDVASGEGTSMEAAIVDAVVTVGGDAVRVGDTLEVVYSGTGKATSVGKTAPKLYRARYTKASESVPISTPGLFSDDEPIG